MLFTGQNPNVSKANEMIWFKKWVLERLTYRYLVKDSGYSKATLERKFKGYLNESPTFQVKAHQQAHLIYDATYFSGDLCLILYYDKDIKYCQFYRFTSSELYVEIREDLANIKKLGIGIISITCDGHSSILKAIKKECPDVITQRCLVHIQRESNIWLRKRPVLTASLELKRIVNLLPKVSTYNDKIFWTRTFLQWYKNNQSFINEQKINIATGRKWYIHKDLRRTAVMISKALPNMFQYLNDPQIPKSTNAVESFFGHLKDTISIHRGLSYKNRKAFILWYLHFKNQSRE